MRRSRRRLFKRDTDEERLIVRDRAFLRMHEISHYRQSSETGRTVTSARQTRNDDHSEHERIRRRRVMRSRKSTKKAFFRSVRKNWSSFSLIITILLDHHHHVSFIVLSITAECHFRAHELSTKLKTSKVRKNSKSSIWENMIVLRSFDKKTWSFWDLSTKRLDRFEVCTGHSMIRTRRSKYKSETKQSRWMWDDYKTITEQKIAHGDLSERSEKSPSTIWSLNDHHFSCFLSCTDDVKYHFRYSSHAVTWGRNGVWIKQTNKQTNKTMNLNYINQI
jgi:hypothetical protein